MRSRASQSVICILLITASANAQTIWYVDDNGNAANGCTSWADACPELQTALSLALFGDQIWVAEGTYRPDYDVKTGQHTGNRFATFHLINGRAIYGGYAGIAESDPDERDTTRYQTVLSGDLAGDDQPGFVNYSENSIQVLFGQDINDPTTRLDGVTITGGSASWEDCCFYQRGAGMYLVNARPAINDCIFTANQALGSWARGGGIYMVTNSDVPVTKCVFYGNHANVEGGAIYIQSSSPSIFGSRFQENTAAGGGAIRAWINSSPTIVNCEFIDNHAVSFGGALWASTGGSSVVMSGCLLQGNVSDWEGSGIYSSASDLTVANCRFIGNVGDAVHVKSISYPATALLYNCKWLNNTGRAIVSWANNDYPVQTTLVNCTVAGNAGGGVFNIGPAVAIVWNSILWNNGGSYEGHQLHLGCCGSIIEVNYSCVQGLTGGYGGKGNFGSDPLFIDQGSGDLHLQAESPCIDTADNSAVPADVETDLDGNPRIVDGDDDGLPVVDMGAYEFNPCHADLDDDGAVGAADLAELLGSWGSCEGCPADFDGDGDVDAADLAQLLGDWGPCW